MAKVAPPTVIVALAGTMFSLAAAKASLAATKISIAAAKVVLAAANIVLVVARVVGQFLQIYLVGIGNAQIESNHIHQE